MTMFVLQVAFFIAVAFGLGCLLGCWLKGRLGGSQHHSGAAAAVTHEGAARTVTAGELAAPIPHYEPESSPQPISALAPKPETAGKPASEAADPAVDAKSPKARKSSRAKAAMSPAGKAAAPQAKTSRSRTTGARTETASGEKQTIAKPAPAKAKPRKASPVAPAAPDNLKQIKGIGPQIEAKLNAAGINSFSQIAAWSTKQQAEFAEQLSFAGRIEREQWVSQAKILAKGGSTDFAKRVAKGEVASSANKPKRGGKA
jgi:predicted flap endonuclease-1-like 5' DNA nuclease